MDLVVLAIWLVHTSFITWALAEVIFTTATIFMACYGQWMCLFDQIMHHMTHQLCNVPWLPCSWSTQFGKVDLCQCHSHGLKGTSDDLENIYCYIAKESSKQANISLHNGQTLLKLLYKLWQVNTKTKNTQLISLKISATRASKSEIQHEPDIIVVHCTPFT